jgi:hypothetical protein
MEIHLFKAVTLTIIMAISHYHFSCRASISGYSAISPLPVGDYATLLFLLFFPHL